MPSTTQPKPTQSAKIEKRRHEPADFAPQVGPPRGVLQTINPRDGAFFHQRLAPPPSLATWIQHYWYVQWDLRDAPPSLAETLPHPNAYLVFEHDLQQPRNAPHRQKNAELSGVTTGKFSRIMEGHGRVFGLKFTAGGLRPFLQTSTSTLTNRIVPAEAIFGNPILTLASKLRRQQTPEAMSKATSAWLAAHTPAPDANVSLATQLVDTIFANPNILSVDHLALHTGIGIRSLQRLFKNYVGVPPKWVIRRYRLHEFVERAHTSEATDTAQLALDLGYADQAHLINDFRKLSGHTPGEYIKRTTR